MKQVTTYVGIDAHKEGPLCRDVDRSRDDAGGVAAGQ
jgi:hypothetical protein